MKNVGIICGGFSSEFDISVKSATNIKENFPDSFKVYLIELSQEGWYAVVEDKRIEIDLKNLSFEYGVNEVKIDIAIVYIHGEPGENGKVQAYLDMINVPYLNSGPLASQLSFDKWYCNQFLKGFEIGVADSIYLTNASKDIVVDDVIDQLNLPIFVKPCDSGSSYGIAKVKVKEELIPAVDAAFREGNSVVLESFLDGTEVTCGAYRSTKGVVALPVTEIVAHNDFFDFEAKYAGLSEEITPARISNDLTEQVQKLTEYIYELLQLRSIARIDYMIVNNELYVIEVNTTPGFSNESIVPKMIDVKGMSVKDLWTEILAAEGHL